MASGRTTPAKIRLATSHEVRPELELQLDHPASTGATMRVTVFDEDLFRMGSLSKDYVAVFSVFAGYGAQAMPSAVQDPASLIGDGSNGVLLTFETTVVGDTPKGALPKHQKWAFGAPQSVVTCNPADLLVDIALGMRDEYNEVAYGPLIRLPRSRAIRWRRLVVVVSDPATQKIEYSNTWRTSTTVKFNAQAGPSKVDGKAVEAAVPALVGGTGEGSGAPAPAGRPLPSMDITGMWEAFSSSNAQMGAAMPSLMVQLCTAGGAIAGWWAPPPNHLTGVPDHALRLTQPAVSPPLEHGRHGALLGHFEPHGYEILWAPTNTSQDPLPHLVGANSATPNPEAGTGTLAIDAQERLQLTLRRGTEETTLHLRMAEPTPRWSNATIDQVLARTANSSPYVRRLVRLQEQPIPLVFWFFLEEDMLPTGALGSLMIAYETTPKSEKSARLVLFTRIDNYLLQLVDVASYCETVMAYFTLHAGNAELTIGGVTRSIYEWLYNFAAEYLDSLTPPPGQSVTSSLLPPGFKAIGIAPRCNYLYKVEFYSLGAKLDAGITVGAYGFEAIVRRKWLVNGVETEPDPKDPWYTRSKTLWGVFGDIGFSVGQGLKGGSSKMLWDVDFRSFQNIKFDHFNKATFYVVSGKALSISWLIASVSGPNSAMIVFTVETTQGGAAGTSARMVAAKDNFVSYPDPSKPPTQLVKKFSFGPSWSLFSMTLGWGWMSEQDPAVTKLPTPQTPPEATLGQAERNVTAYFRRNSSTLEGRNLSAVEEFIALERAIFASGGGWARAVGHASPEGPDNTILSRRRAENVIQVLQNALGNRVAVSTGAIGFGHTAAVNAGLIRPEDITAGPAGASQRVLYRKQENNNTLFPQYRIVVLWVCGVLLIKVGDNKTLPGRPQ